MSEYLFYDTSSLLNNVDNLFKPYQHFIISSITLDELERIKNARDKDNEIKYAAKAAIRQLKQHIGKYIVWIYKPAMLAPIEAKGLEITNDMKIVASALDYDKKVHPDEVVFVTSDLSQYNLANLFFGEDSIRLLDEEKEDDYCGVREVELTDAEMANFYENEADNPF